MAEVRGAAALPRRGSGSVPGGNAVPRFVNPGAGFRGAGAARVGSELPPGEGTAVSRAWCVSCWSGLQGGIATFAFTRRFPLNCPLFLHAGIQAAQEGKRVAEIRLLHSVSQLST